MSDVRNIAILALPKSDLFDIAGPFEAFVRASEIAAERYARATPVYRVDLLSIASPSIQTWAGLKFSGAIPFTRYRREPDTLIVTGRPDTSADELDPRLKFWLLQRAANTRRVCSVCTGVFCLAEAGLLAGRQATTHWQYAAELAARHPEVRVNPEPLFLRDGNIYTSAGCTAAMDIALAFIEDDLGSGIASEIAREMILFVRRAGGQPQFSALLTVQTSDRQPLRDVQNWIIEHLHLPLTIEDLAEQVHMSPRNFARVFSKELKTTPARFIEALRIEAARRRLEETPRSVEEIAAECGFGTAETMRRSFLRAVKTPPSAYRSSIRSA